jgi:hypothetical protein
MNQKTPKLQATIKLHKQNTHMIPIINWNNVPAYEIAKYLRRILHNCLHLPNTYNIQNSIHLTTNLQSIECDEDLRIRLFDIKNMYTNILKLEFVSMIENTMQNDLEITKLN